LALRLWGTHASKADKRLALVELVRIDVHHPAAAGIIRTLEPIVEKYPLDPVALMALGRALVREGKADEGLGHLQNAVTACPELSRAWYALLDALEDAGRVEDLTKTLSLAPRDILPDTGRAKYEGWLAQVRGDWSNAVAAYRRACESQPADAQLLYRLSRVTRLNGDKNEADRLEQSVRDIEAAGKQLRTFYEQHERELREDKPHAALFQEVASLKERLGRREEARNWHTRSTQPRRLRSPAIALEFEGV
jgi:tetratricopeptide (TPR) repeat protein